MPSSRVTVAHVHRVYLNLTENWIYRQVRFLRDVRSIFVAKRPANLDQFPWPDVFLLADEPRLAREWNRLLFNLRGWFPYYRRVCREQGVGLLHAHSGAIGRDSVALAGSLGVPLVTSFYGYEMSAHPEGVEGLRRVYRRLFARGAAFVAEGPYAAAQLVRLGCPPVRVHIHRLGIDPEEIEMRPRRPEPEGEFRVLMAARFDEKKGLPDGLEAFCRVARDEPRLRLTLVGDAGPPKEEQAVKAEILRILERHAAVRHRVELTGFVPMARLRELGYSHHLFVHPSIHASNGDAEGGHPVVLTEMAAAGMPIVSTRHCDIPEVVVDGETGWLCAEHDVDCLERAIREACARPERLAGMGRRARALVERKYDARRDTLDAVYAKVLGPGAGG